MTPAQIGELTMAQFQAYLKQIPYVSMFSDKYGKRPPQALPQIPILRYAERCGIIVPFEVREDLVINGY